MKMKLIVIIVKFRWYMSAITYLYLRISCDGAERRRNLAARKFSIKMVHSLPNHALQSDSLLSRLSVNFSWSRINGFAIKLN